MFLVIKYKNHDHNYTNTYLGMKTGLAEKAENDITLLGVSRGMLPWRKI